MAPSVESMDHGPCCAASRAGSPQDDELSAVGPRSTEVTSGKSAPPEMVRVEGGAFLMGTEDPDGFAAGAPHQAARRLLRLGGIPYHPAGRVAPEEGGCPGEVAGSISEPPPPSRAGYGRTLAGARKAHGLKQPARSTPHCQESS